MFESKSATDHDSKQVTRRVFLSTAIAAICGVGLLALRRPHRALADDVPPHASGPVAIVLFSDDGKRLKKVTLAKMVKSASDWQKQLSPNVYDIARLAD